jgi:hypothetical protein
MINLSLSPRRSFYSYASPADEQLRLGSVEHGEEAILFIELCGRDLATSETRLIVLTRNLLLAAAILEPKWRSKLHLTTTFRPAHMLNAC